MCFVVLPLAASLLSKNKLQCSTKEFLGHYFQLPWNASDFFQESKWWQNRSRARTFLHIDRVIWLPILLMEAILHHLTCMKPCKILGWIPPIKNRNFLRINCLPSDFFRWQVSKKNRAIKVDVVSFPKNHPFLIDCLLLPRFWRSLSRWITRRSSNRALGAMKFKPSSVGLW